MAAPLMPDRVNVEPEAILRQARELRRAERAARHATLPQALLYGALALNAYPPFVATLGFGEGHGLKGLIRGVRAAVRRSEPVGHGPRSKVLVFCWESTDAVETEAYRVAWTTPYLSKRRTVMDLADPGRPVVFFRNPGPRGTDLPDWAWAIDMVRGTLPDMRLGLFVHFGDCYRARVAPEVEQLRILMDDRTRIIVARANEPAGQNVVDVLCKQGWRWVNLNHAGNIVLCQH